MEAHHKARGKRMPIKKIGYASRTYWYNAWMEESAERAAKGYEVLVLEEKLKNCEDIIGKVRSLDIDYSEWLKSYKEDVKTEADYDDQMFKWNELTEGWKELHEALAKGQHDWIDFNGTPVCKICTIVRRADDKNKPCKGKPKMRPVIQDEDNFFQGDGEA